MIPRGDRVRERPHGAATCVGNALANLADGDGVGIHTGKRIAFGRGAVELIGASTLVAGVDNQRIRQETAIDIGGADVLAGNGNIRAQRDVAAQIALNTGRQKALIRHDAAAADENVAGQFRNAFNTDERRGGSDTAIKGQVIRPFLSACHRNRNREHDDSKHESSEIEHFLLLVV